MKVGCCKAGETGVGQFEIPDFVEMEVATPSIVRKRAAANPKYWSACAKVMRDQKLPQSAESCGFK